MKNPNGTMKKVLISLRKQAGITQEQIAEKIGVSRQAVVNWEKGESNPDIDNCIALADLYHISLDDLVRGSDSQEIFVTPKNKFFFGTLKVGAGGEIIIPKKARDLFQIHEGDLLLLLGEEGRKLALLPKNELEQFMQFLGCRTG